MDDDVVPYRHLTPLGRKLIDLWGGWKCTAYHPCIDGFYVTEYENRNR